MKILLALAADPHAGAIRAALAELGWGARVETAGLPAEVARQAEHDEVDAVVVPTGPEAGPLLRALRRAGPDLALLALGAAPDLAGKRRLFAGGADDVLAHPVEAEEIALRALAIARRRNGHAAPRLVFGDLAIVPGEGAYLRGTLWRLTRVEWAVIELLALRAGRLVSREALMARLYADRAEPPEGKVLDVVLCRLRGLLRQDGLDPALIATIWGQGYAMPPPFAPGHPMPPMPAGTTRFVPQRLARGAPTAPLAEAGPCA